MRALEGPTVKAMARCAIVIITIGALGASVAGASTRTPSRTRRWTPLGVPRCDYCTPTPRVTGTSTATCTPGGHPSGTQPPGCADEGPTFTQTKQTPLATPRTPTCTPHSAPYWCTSDESLVCPPDPCGYCQCVENTPAPSPSPTEFFPACCSNNTCPRLCAATPTPTATGECPPASTPPPQCESGETAVCADYRCSVSCGCACTGDCDRNGMVAIDELMAAVNMLLNGVPPTDACLAALCSCHPGSFCLNGVSIACIVRAVGHALSGCPVATAATATPPRTSTPTIPAALSAALDEVCTSQFVDRREVTVDQAGYSVICDRFEHNLRSSVRQLATSEAARVALDELRERGSAVAFHEADAIAWSENTQGGPVFRQNHVWSLGCWFVWAYSEDVGGAIILDPRRLSEAIYSAGIANGLFDTCAPAPISTSRLGETRASSWSRSAPR